MGGHDTCCWIIGDGGVRLHAVSTRTTGIKLSRGDGKEKEADESPKKENCANGRLHDQFPVAGTAGALPANLLFAKRACSSRAKLSCPRTWINFVRSEVISARRLACIALSCPGGKNGTALLST